MASAQLLCQPDCVSLNRRHRCTSDQTSDEGSTKTPALAKTGLNPFTAMSLIWCRHVDVGALRALNC